MSSFFLIALVGAYVLSAGVTVLAAVVLASHFRLRDTMKTNVRAELALVGHLRRTMEDLRDRDPVIAESIEFELSQLDRLQPVLAALADGDLSRSRQLRRQAGL